MNPRITTATLLALCLLSTLASAADAPRITQTAPAEGLLTVEARELWRAGGEDDEENFFGVTTDAETGPDGRVYLLDNQLSTVHVYEADGTFVGQIGREGEGPGEFRYPTGFARLADGALAVTQGMGGRIVVIEEDGTPRTSLIPGDAAAGGFQTFFDIRTRGPHMVLCAAGMVFGEEGMNETRHLSAYDAAKESFGTRYWEQTGVRDMSKPRFIEKDEYFAQNRYDVDDEGRVYVAEKRNAYEISVYSPDGGLERVIALPDHVPHVRTSEEKDAVTSGMVIMTENGRLEIENVVEDADPAISSLFLDDDGLLWVADSRAERHDGVFRRYGVFTTDGRWLRDVDLVIPGDNAEDGLLPLGDGRFIHVVGMVNSAEAMGMGLHGGDDEDDESDGGEDPLEVICYTI
jgi:hypothetical protein